MALLFTVLCGAVAIILGLFINFFAKGHFVQSTEAIIESEIRYIEALGTNTLSDSHNGRLYISLDDQGNLPQGFPLPDNRLAEGLLVFDLPENGKRYAARLHTFDDGQKILIGTDITDISNDYRFMQWIGITSIGFVMVVVFISYIISIFVVRGTNKIANTAHDIMRTGDLTRRVEVASKWDDLSSLASTLNLLLDRIETLMHGVKHVSDNIAHDLRTPLTRMRNHIEDMQAQHPDNAACTALLDEADHLLETFNALLRISRLETEQQRSQFQKIALHNILNDVIEFYQPLAEEKDISISHNLNHASLHGDRDLLFQAFANLMDNAVKFTPRGGHIDIALTNYNGTIQLSIQNSSNGLTEGDLDNIFKRFYRTDKSRNIPGTGLGLSLVAAIIHLHDGTITARNIDNGFEIITII